METNDTFRQARDETLNRVLSLLQTKIDGLNPPLLLNINEIAPTLALQAAERESWALLQSGVLHLKNGAPGNQPGSMAEALSKASLRRSSLAAALGIKPPQFEQIYFPADFSTGHEAAIFFCARLSEAVEGDILKSRQILQQKVYAADTAATLNLPDREREDFRRQTVTAFNMLVKSHAAVCRAFRAELSAMKPPPARPKNPGPAL